MTNEAYITGGESRVDTAHVAGKRATLRGMREAMTPSLERWTTAELVAEIATLREGRDLARQAGAELVEEVRALREVLGERSRDLHWSEHKDFDEYRNRVGPLACQREPCATDRRLTQEEEP